MIEMNKHLDFDQDKLVIMLSMQDELNKKITRQWHRQGWDWARAIISECSELSDYIGWKWWKAHPKADVTQAELEVVDIWHFGLSMIVEAVIVQVENQKGNLDEALTYMAGIFASNWTYDDIDADAASELAEWTVFDSIDNLIVDSVCSNSFNVTAFRRLCEHFGMTFDRLFSLYVSKHVLNSFRWKHGYKEGSYIKTWAGKEDNEVMADLLAEGYTHPDELLQQLELKYRLLTAH